MISKTATVQPVPGNPGWGRIPVPVVHGSAYAYSHPILKVRSLKDGIANLDEAHQCVLVCANELIGLPCGPRSIQRRMFPIGNEVDLGFHAFQLVVLPYQELANDRRYDLVFVLSDGRVSCCTCFIELRLQPDERYGALHVRSRTAWADHLLIGVIAYIVVVFV